MSISYCVYRLVCLSAAVSVGRCARRLLNGGKKTGRKKRRDERKGGMREEERRRRGVTGEGCENENPPPRNGGKTSYNFLTIYLMSSSRRLECSPTDVANENANQLCKDNAA